MILDFIILIFLVILIFILYIISLFKNSYIINVSHGLYIFIISALLQLNDFTVRSVNYYNVSGLDNESQLFLYNYNNLNIPEELIIIFLVIGCICIFRGIVLIMKK